MATTTREEHDVGETVPGTMRAVVQDRYGGPEVLRVGTVETPTPDPGRILVRVHAAAANPLDWHLLRGEPYLVRLGDGLRRPSQPVRGVDVAGTVVAVGEGVTRFAPGDRVFGEAPGAFAEYVAGREDKFANVPDGVGFEAAAAVPVAGTTALQGLRDEGNLREGQSVLVNGASGGVGTFAVQLAAAFGAEVTGVCSGGNAELVESLGAARVVDYTRADFTREGSRYDLVFDAVGNRSLRALRRATTPSGTVVFCGAPEGRWVRPLLPFLTATVAAPVVSQRLRAYLATVDVERLETLSGFLESGEVTPVVDRTYPLEAAADAIRYLETGRARGKVVLVP